MTKHASAAHRAYRTACKALSKLKPGKTHKRRKGRKSKKRRGGRKS